MIESYHFELLRRTFELAAIARKQWHAPFGALVAEGARIVCEAIDTRLPTSEFTCHAEMNAIRAAQARISPERLGHAFVYASSEPCVMCTAAIFYAGIRGIVYGFPGEKLDLILREAGNVRELRMPCRTVLARAGRELIVIGPLSELEAATVHQGFWGSHQNHPRKGFVLDKHSQKPTPGCDELHLRRAIDLASGARRAGELPFGAVAARASGEVMVEATSTEIGERDWTCHAETNVVRSLARVAPDVTLYASSEPCAMCAAAIHNSGIRRVVFGFAEPRLRLLLGSGETQGLGFSCREVLSHSSESVDVVGPLLETEAETPHRGYWEARKRSV